MRFSRQTQPEGPDTAGIGEEPRYGRENVQDGQETGGQAGAFTQQHQRFRETSKPPILFVLATILLSRDSTADCFLNALCVKMYMLLAHTYLSSREQFYPTSGFVAALSG